MKKIILFSLTLIIALSSFAQLKPEEGDFGLSFRLTGLANVGFFAPVETVISHQEIHDPLGIFGPGTSFNVNNILPQQMLMMRYYLSPTTAMRIALGAGYHSDKITMEDAVASQMIERTLSAYSLGLNWGLEWHYASAAVKIDPYSGFQINGAYLGKVKRETEVMDLDELPLNIEEILYPAGYGLGLHLFTGFHYFFSSNFALGAEMSIGFDRISMGGVWTRLQTESTTGNILVEETGRYKNVNNSLNIGSTAGVNISVFF